MKIAVPTYFMSDVVAPNVRTKIEQTLSVLKESGMTVDYVDVKYLDQAVIIYQIIVMAEASSNLARFDGIRYGHSIDTPKNIEDLYFETRKEGFGKEVKRRIMIGSYLLSGDNAKTYYNKALSIRDDMKKELKNLFEKYDFIIGPTAISTAYDVDSPMDDPLQTFMDDALVFPANLAGLPGLNIPVGLSEDNMPIGMHIIGNDFEEAKMYQLASFIEKKLNLNLTPGGDK